METETLTIETHPTREAVDFLEDQINAYNITETGITFGGLLASFVRDAAGQIVAGIYGWTWGDCCEIKSLWVHADWRGQGYGTRLLQAAEQEALRRGCAQMVLSTHSFQAPEFYRKRGYEIVGIVEGYPHEHQSLYLRKPLRPSGPSNDARA
jgi:GNAT superfamily N-acetyltransferase